MVDQMPYTRSDGPPPKASRLKSRWEAMIADMVAHPGQWFQSDCQINAHASNIVDQVWRNHKVRAEATFREGVVYARVIPTEEEPNG